MNYSRSAKLLNIIFIILGVIGILSIFAEWYYLQATTPPTGDAVTNSFTKSPAVPGIQTWAGPIVIVLFLAQMAFVFLKSHQVQIYALVPPALNFLLAFLFIVTFDVEAARTMVSGIPESNLKALDGVKFSFGIYLTMLGSVLSMIAGFVRYKEIASDGVLSWEAAEVAPETVADEAVPVEAAEEPVTSSGYEQPVYNEMSEPVALDEAGYEETTDSTPPGSDEDEEEDLPHAKGLYVLLGAVILILVGVLVYLTVDIGSVLPSGSSDEMKAEKRRLDSLIEAIDLSIVGKNYDGALLSLSYLKWNYNPTAYPDEVSYYRKQQELLYRSVQNLQGIKTEPAMVENEVLTPPLFEAEVKVSRAYFYAQPSYSTRRQQYVVEGQRVSIHRMSGDFWYASFNYGSVVTKGWVARSDFSRDDSEISIEAPAVDTTSYEPPVYEEPVTIGSKYRHSAKKWEIELSSDGSLTLSTETSRTPHTGTWSLNGERVSISVPTLNGSSWNLVVKRNGLYDKAGNIVWIKEY